MAADFRSSILKAIEDAWLIHAKELASKFSLGPINSNIKSATTSNNSKKKAKSEPSTLG